MDTLQTERISLFTPDFVSLFLPEREVCQYMGYGDHAPDERIVEMIRSMKQELASICRPRFGYCSVAGQVPDRESLLLAGKAVTPGRIITSYLKESEFFLILVATAGREYDEWKANLQEEGDIVRLYVADALGSTIVEAVVAQAMEHLEAVAEESGLHISNSYSPGYCGWHVSEQKTIFSLLPDEFCGVTLTESSLMLPIKSVSAVIGVGARVVKKPYGCAICRKKDCFKRRLSTAGKAVATT